MRSLLHEPQDAPRRPDGDLGGARRDRQLFSTNSSLIFAASVYPPRGLHSAAACPHAAERARQPPFLFGREAVRGLPRRRFLPWLTWPLGAPCAPPGAPSGVDLSACSVRTR